MSKKAYIRHITSYYPENVEYNSLDDRITPKIGIFERHIATQEECASDLAVGATEKLFKKYNVKRTDIDAIIFCTQTPDYIMPSTACIIQGRLKIPHNCMAFDFNQGCSGFIYGLSLAKGLIESGQTKNVLLLTGDTLSKLLHQKDMRTKPLFGDAAAATLICGKESDVELLHSFHFGTNGEDFKKIVINYGGMRMKYANRDAAYKEIQDQYGNVRTDATIYMDGKGVVQFTQQVIPNLMNNVLQSAKLKLEDIDLFIFHQANKFMLDNVRKACGIPYTEKYFNDCSKIGNTSSSSIPNAINNIQEKNITLGKKCMLMGFGVGLTWGGCIADLSSME